MKKFAFAILSVAAVSFAATAQAGVIGNYTSATGGVSFSYDDSDGNLAGIRVNASDLVAGQATDLGGTITGALSVINDQAPNFIEWGNLVGFTFTDADAGAILPSGLAEGDLSNYELLFRSLAAPTVDITGTWSCLDCSPGGIEGTPAPGGLDLGMIVAAGGLIEDAITFTGAPTAADFSNQSIPNLFFANIDGNSIDIGVDMVLAQTFAAGTVATGDLSISGDGGPFDYQVEAVIPEPTTIGLAGLALAGVFAARRR